jgi:hypothetical protein
VKKLSLLVSATALAVVLPSAANASVCVGGSEFAPTVTGPTSGVVSCFYPGDAEFTTSPAGATTGIITADFGRSGVSAGTFTDLYQFIIDEDGVGSGAVTTSVAFNQFQGSTDLDFIEVWVNGVAIPIVLNPPAGPTPGLGETAQTFFVPITAGVLNTIQIEYLSRGDGSYGGNATFTPNAAVPEPATWAMMLLGFGAIGFGMRRRRKETARVRFAF